MNILVFDIETIPDINAGRTLYNLNDLDEKAVADALFAKQRQKNGSNFLPLHLHQVVAISLVLKKQDQLKVWSLGSLGSNEKEIIQRFFDGIEKFTPDLVSWNGSGFDFPVLHYRAMLHGVVAQRYWETGDCDNQFRWNNYINRYHYRHMDVMDILAAYQGRANAPLDQIASLCGFPGKMGMSGANVWESYQQGQLEGIRNYCETDVLNTYLVYLRFQMMRGQLLPDAYEKECALLRDYLKSEDKAHFQEFLAHWE